ncbi:taurine ABC transporter substrate-binding protein [Pandoraea communis]|uniref:taurine ABC transporter substrate-binding protein n=1 Tax=Pandoraea communis TaxID=2508297 RepID=UPI0025A5E90A|nr:taurine ABC transporter substrate-binding protein [Pandoraea communis]MDM8359135.1 taurine ABC transporter substrate-binding protein [Pandoraea communis]
MKRIARIAGAVMGALCFMVSGLLTPVSAAEKVVNIAYQTTYSPWIAAMVNGAFERATGYRIHWKKFDSGAAVMSAMASGSVDIGVLGSSPLAAAASRGMDIQLFWILEDIANAEALMVRNAANIASPQDLKGKTIAVPVASTSHYQLMYMLDKWGLTQQVKLVNMTPAQAAAAWERGDVDGAFIWGPALGRIRPTGKPLITAGQICELGRCTFEGMAVTKPFGAANPDFMAKFIEVLNSTNRDFAAHPEAWAVGSSNLAAVIKGLGGKPEDAAEEMALYKYPALADQVSCQWLGCGAKGGAAKTLTSTAEFLLQQKKIDAVKSDYSSAVAVRYPEATLGLTRK